MSPSPPSGNGDAGNGGSGVGEVFQPHGGVEKFRRFSNQVGVVGSPLMDPRKGRDFGGLQSLDPMIMDYYGDGGRQRTGNVSLLISNSNVINHLKK